MQIPSRTQALRRRPLTSPLLTTILLGIVAVVAVGCGSSKPTSTIGVGYESNALPKEAQVTAVTTPTTGPLSKEPKVTPPSGPAPTKLEKRELIKGTGAVAKDGETVTVNYVGVLYHGGKVFNASWETHETFSFELGAGKVIAGWDQGVVGMRVGGRRELIIPASLAYGKKGSPPTIPANEPLIFVVDLLAV